MTQIALDLDHVRRQFPGLDRGWTLFDNAGGSQILKGAVDRMTAFLYENNVQIGGTYDLSVAAAESLREARVAAAADRHLQNGQQQTDSAYSPFAAVAEELGYEGDPTLEPSPFFTTLHGYRTQPSPQS